MSKLFILVIAKFKYSVSKLFILAIAEFNFRQFNFSFKERDSLLAPKFKQKTIWEGGSVFDDQGSRICIVLSFYYLKFLTLKDIASATLMCQMVYFLRENEPVLLKFSVGCPQTPPLLHSVLTPLKKRRNKEEQTNSRIKNDLLNTITNPPFFFFFFFFFFTC